jgi:hypothetical protein
MRPEKREARMRVAGGLVDANSRSFKSPGFALRGINRLDLLRFSHQTPHWSTHHLVLPKSMLFGQ